MNTKRLLIAGLAALGLGVGHTAATVLKQSEVRSAAVANGGQQSSRALKEDDFGGIANSMLGHISRGNGCPPDIWGKSRACARMVRKNRMRALGIRGSRI